MIYEKTFYFYNIINTFFSQLVLTLEQEHLQVGFLTMIHTAQHAQINEQAKNNPHCLY